MNDLFIELLQISLGNRGILSRTPSEKEWMGLFIEAQRQAIIGVLLTGIENLPEDQWPKQDLLLQWVGLCQMVEQTNNLHLKRARELTVWFNGTGFQSCVLKGIGIAQLYPSPLRRQCGDIDLWVSGERKKIMQSLRSKYKVGEVRWHHADVQLYDDVQTEIHFHATWLFNPKHNKKLQAFLDGHKEDEMAARDIGFGYPSVPFNAIYSLVHSFHHLLESGIGFRHIVDYYHIIKHLQQQEIDEVISMIKEIGLLRFLQAMMYVLQKVCGMPDRYLFFEPNEKEGRFLLDEIMRGGNFGKFRNDNLRRNTVARMIALLPHYPDEVLWLVPWKLWHKGWRMMYK